MSAEEEEAEKCEAIKAYIRMYVSLDQRAFIDTEGELSNAADAIWRHVIVPMCRT